MKKIKKGDKVKVISGKDRGRTGSVVKVLRKKSQAIVKGINLVKKHVKPSGKDQKGGIVEIEKPLWLSKLALFCSECGKPTRVGYQLDKGGKKYRFCRKCKSLIGKPKVKK